MDKAFVEQMQKKVERELAGREAEAVDFWKIEIEKLLHKKSESLSALQQDLRNVVVRMENRLKVLKRG